MAVTIEELKAKAAAKLAESKAAEAAREFEEQNRLANEYQLTLDSGEEVVLTVLPEAVLLEDLTIDNLPTTQQAISRSNGTTTPAPLSNASQIIDKINNLQKQLEHNLPGYAGLLHEIHRALSKDDELVTLLTPAQFGIVVSGLSKKTGIIIAEEGKKGRPRKDKLPDGRKLSEVTLEDI